MRTITFYSFKGGVGRTLCAVNFAIYAARLGIPTAIADFDLDAPGVAAKLGGAVAKSDAPGLLDYLLTYQQTGQLGADLGSMARPVTLPAPAAKLLLLPAGAALDHAYPNRLRALHMNELFSEEREGVAFFLEFLESVERDLGVALLVVDSKSGVGELAGVCTHLLPDDVVVLASEARENAQVQQIIKGLRESELAKELGKATRTLLVHSRVPRGQDADTAPRPVDYRSADAATIHASPKLAVRDFLALLTPAEDGELTQEYLTLFRQLPVEPRMDHIAEQVRSIAADLLSIPIEESERRLQELALLCPRSPVYPALLRLYQIEGKQQQAREQGVSLLKAARPEDRDALADAVAELYVGYLQQHRALWRRQAEERKEQTPPLGLDVEQAAMVSAAIARRAEREDELHQRAGWGGSLDSRSRWWMLCVDLYELTCGGPSYEQRDPGERLLLLALRALLQCQSVDRALAMLKPWVQSHPALLKRSIWSAILALLHEHQALIKRSSEEWYGGGPWSVAERKLPALLREKGALPYVLVALYGTPTDDKLREEVLAIIVEDPSWIADQSTRHYLARSVLADRLGLT